MDEKYVSGVLLDVAYRGGSYSGFVVQKDTRTIEGALRIAVRALDSGASATRGVSRTDAGVHAEMQKVAFDATLEIPPRGWVLGMNQHLPPEIAVRRARVVPVDFQPRFAATWKRYRYTLLLDRVRDPAKDDRAWRVGWEMSLQKMRAICNDILGEHDFAAFRGAKDDRANTVRLVRSLVVEEDPIDPRVVTIRIEGSAFMYNMVRIIVGTLVDVARGHLSDDTFRRALGSKDRRDLGQTAPPEGLCLEHVELVLPEETGEPWPG